MSGTLYEDLGVFMIISCWNEKFSDEICEENQHKFCGQCFFFSENHPVYEIMWKNIVQPDRHR